MKIWGFLKGQRTEMLKSHYAVCYNAVRITGIDRESSMQTVDKHCQTD